MIKPFPAGDLYDYPQKTAPQSEKCFSASPLYLYIYRNSTALLLVSCSFEIEWLELCLALQSTYIKYAPAP